MVAFNWKFCGTCSSILLLCSRGRISHTLKTERRQGRCQNWKKKRGVRDVALITVKRSDSKWSDAWQSQQATTLRDLELEDMAMDSSYKPGQVPADAVTVDLSVQKVGKITQKRNWIPCKVCILTSVHCESTLWWCSCMCLFFPLIPIFCTCRNLKQNVKVMFQLVCWGEGRLGGDFLCKLKCERLRSNNATDALRSIWCRSVTCSHM